MRNSEEILVKEYRAQAETFLAQGRVDDALWNYESALLDPRLADTPNQRATLGNLLGELQLLQLPQLSEQGAIRKRLEHTISLLRSCLPGADEPNTARTQLLMARLHCEGFDRFGERRDLLVVHMLIDELVRLRPQDSALQAEIDNLRDRINAAQATRNSL